VTEQSLDDLVQRLERERQAADRAYNAALTAVDRALSESPALPDAPAPFDERKLGDVNRTWDILPTGPPPTDRSFKGRLRALIWRIVGPPLETQKQFNASLVEHLNRNFRSAQESPKSLTLVIDALNKEFAARQRFESLLVQYLQTITRYVDSKDRSLGGPELRERLGLTEQRMLALKRDLDRAGSAPPASGGASGTEPLSAGTGGDATTYVGFEDRFRGPQDVIRTRVEDYLPIFAGTSDVVDIGCGRGELLELFRTNGITARGVDANPAMVDLCRSKGLDADVGDALRYLEARADGSLGGLAAIQVVEHFEPPYLAKFLEAAYHTLRPEAPLVLETINPSCWMAFFETYIRDLTHQRPLHADTLRYLVQASGFHDVDIRLRQPVADVDRLDRVSEDAIRKEAGDLAPLVTVLNAHADKLNARLFSSMDYAIVARR